MDQRNQRVSHGSFFVDARSGLVQTSLVSSRFTKHLKIATFTAAARIVCTVDTVYARIEILMRAHKANQPLGT
jgi:hypothetical protein